MAVTKTQARRVRQPTLVGDIEITGTMSAAGSEIIELSSIAEKVTMQSSGTLAYTYSISANGINFTTPVSVAANILATYSTNLTRVITITYVSGSGKVTILAR